MMYKTIEAIYENGKILPLDDSEINIKRGKVLLTILEIYEKKDISPETTFSEKDVSKLAGSITLYEDPLEYQKRMRNEWLTLNRL